MRYYIGGLMLALFVSLATADRAKACSCMVTSPAYQYGTAESVFTGTVTEIDTVDMHLVVSFRALEIFKGIEPATLVVRTHIHSATCGYPGFRVGEDFLVYAFEREEGGLFTHLCTRTAPVENAGEDLTWLRSLGSGSVYIPIEEGNAWTFRVAPADKLTIRAANVTQEADRTYFNLQGISLPFDSTYADAFGNVWWVKDGQERIIADFSVGEGGFYHLMANDQAYRVEVHRDLAVNVGTSRFENCIRLDFREGEDGAVWSATFAPGVGPVLVTSSDGDWYELETAAIAGKHVATSSEMPSISSSISASVHPNPFDGAATIRADLSSATHARVTVHDVLGREVTRLLDSAIAEGEIEIPWNTAELPAGVYFVRIVADGEVAVVSAVKQ